MIKRSFDLVLALITALIFLLPAMLVAIAVKLTSRGPIIYWSTRVGRYNKNFSMPKFRTMITETPVVATDKLENPDRFMTPIGSFLRKTSLDEIPQLWSILIGDMSFVGPRPALPSQKLLVTLRTENKIQDLLPGLTGLAQISGRDNLTSKQKVEFDTEYYQRQSFTFDVYIILKTFVQVLKFGTVSH